jgi:hypothetical protein
MGKEASMLVSTQSWTDWLNMMLATLIQPWVSLRLAVLWKLAV